MSRFSVRFIAALFAGAIAPAFHPAALAATPLLGLGTTENGSIASLYDVDLATGVASNPRNLGVTSVVGITFGPGGTVYGLMTFAGTYPNSLVRIDPATGNTTQIGPTGFSSVFEGDIAYDPVSGRLYGLTDITGTGPDPRNLFTLNPATGAATVVGDIAATGDPSAMAFSPEGALYVLDNVDGGPPDRLYRVDPATGVAISGVDLSTRLGFTGGMAFDPATRNLYVADGGTEGTNALYSVDPSTGVMTRIGGLGPLAPRGLAGLAFVPEPASFAAVVAMGLLAVSRRNRKAEG